MNTFNRHLHVPASPTLAISKEERNLASLDLRDRSAAHLIVADPGAAPARQWMAEHRPAIWNMVSAKGWALIRGLKMTGTADFRNCIAALDVPLIEEYGDLPMMPSQDGTQGVFDVTKYPAKNAILFHNEAAHTPKTIRHIFFRCEIAAEKDGETPLADSAAVLRALPAEIAQAFRERGLLYRRNFVKDLDVSWQQYFGTSSRADVEASAAREGFKLTWHPDGGLATETARPAVIDHPVTGASVFFNQILLHHPAALAPEVRKALQGLLKGQRFPREVCFGDGTPISDEWVAEVLRAHIQEAVSFSWQPGDIVVVDNLAAAHARRPFSGPRQHHVILGGTS